VNGYILENEMAKMKESSAAYNEEAIELALSRVIIKQCKKCGHPKECGYCCGHCGSGESSRNDGESYIEYKGISAT
jgi:methionyl-tRNA synthetase